MAHSRKLGDADLACIEQIRRGEGRGLDTLMERHGEALHRFIFRYANNEEDAADVVQETFVRVFQSAARFKPSASVKTWIYAIALNQCRDRARRLAKVKWIPFLSASDREDGGLCLADTAPGDRSDPADSVGNLELEQAISEAVAALPSSLKAPFVLCVLEGHSQLEAGEILNLSAKSVEVRVYRARKQLRESLAPILSDFGVS